VIPKDYELLIFNRNIEVLNNPYYFNQLAEVSPSGWIFRNVVIGRGTSQDAGHHAEVYAVLMTDAAAKAFTHRDLSLGVSDLPPDGVVVDQIEIERNADSTPCP
jgi:hypothetical protein